jgi:antitoxin PrlF
VKLTSKGQVTIPRKLRDRFGLYPETEVVFEATQWGVLIKPASEARRRRLQVALRRARGSATTGRSTMEIMRLTRGEE